MSSNSRFPPNNLKSQRVSQPLSTQQRGSSNSFNVNSIAVPLASSGARRQRGGAHSPMGRHNDGRGNPHPHFTSDEFTRPKRALSQSSRYQDDDDEGGASQRARQEHSSYNDQLHSTSDTPSSTGVSARRRSVGSHGHGQPPHGRPPQARPGGATPSTMGGPVHGHASRALSTTFSMLPLMTTTPMQLVDPAVKVALRVRPLLESEMQGTDVPTLPPSAEQQATSDVFSSLQQQYVSLANVPGKQFTFDTVAGPQHSQSDVFDNIARPLCDTCLMGYNSTLFAYGQSGSGKTYTIAGRGSAVAARGPSAPPARGRLRHDSHQSQTTDRRSSSHARSRSQSRPRRTDISTAESQAAHEAPVDITDGLLPKSIDYLFEQLDGLVNRPANSSSIFEAKCCLLEVYNDRIIDLLDVTQTKPITLQETASQTSIKNAEIRPIRNADECHKVVQQGMKNRHITSTMMNSQTTTRHSKFTMIDLAGSERVKKSGVSGEKLDEATHINRSLSQLSTVISKINYNNEFKKNEHVPYRDTVLTRLLKDSLGGNSVTCVIACISPSTIHEPETLSTLRFAESARQVKNCITVNEVRQTTQEVEELRAQHQDLLHMVHFLQSMASSGSMEQLQTSLQQLDLTSFGFSMQDSNSTTPFEPTACEAAQHRLVHRSKQYTELIADVNKLENSLSQLQSDYDELLTKHTTLEGEYSDQTMSLHCVETKLDEVSHENAQFRSQVQDLTDIIDSNQQKINTLHDDLCAAETEIKSLQDENEALTSELNVLNERVLAQEKRISYQNAEISSLNNQIQQQVLRIEAMRQAIDDLYEEIRQHKLDLEQKEDRITALVHLEEKLTQEIQQLNMLLEKSQQTNEDLTLKLGEKLAECSTLKEELQQTTLNRDEKVEMILVLTNQIKRSKELEDENTAKLQDTISTLSTTIEDYQAQVDNLHFQLSTLQQSSQGTIQNLEADVTRLTRESAQLTASHEQLQGSYSALSTLYQEQTQRLQDTEQARDHFSKEYDRMMILNLGLSGHNNYEQRIQMFEITKRRIEELEAKVREKDALCDELRRQCNLLSRSSYLDRNIVIGSTTPTASGNTAPQSTSVAAPSLQLPLPSASSGDAAHTTATVNAAQPYPSGTTTSTITRQLAGPALQPVSNNTLNVERNEKAALTSQSQTHLQGDKPISAMPIKRQASSTSSNPPSLSRPVPTIPLPIDTTTGSAVQTPTASGGSAPNPDTHPSTILYHHGVMAVNPNTLSKSSIQLKPIRNRRPLKSSR